MAMPALLIEVGDTTRALQDLAREVRRRSGARVVAITGSAGKTTTKEVDRGVSVGALRRVSQQGEPEQPYRPSALAS